MTALKGTYTVLVTPFDANDHIDEDGFRQLIQMQLESNIDGLVCLGTTGEDPTLSQEEKKRLITIAREEIGKSTPLVIGTGSYATAQTIKSTQQAETMGADMALIVSPYYNRPTQEGLYQHFKAIASETKIPIIIYNVPSRTGNNLQIDTLKRLMEIPNIIGVKEASGSIIQIGEVIEAVMQVRPEFSVMSGDDAFTFPLMALGGQGVLSVVSNLIPQAVKALTDALEKGEYLEARKMHFHLLPLFKAAFIETNPIPIKAALNLAGLPAGQCRLPLCPLNPESTTHLTKVLQRYVDLCFPAYL